MDYSQILGAQLLNKQSHRDSDGEDQFYNAFSFERSARLYAACMKFGSWLIGVAVETRRKIQKPANAVEIRDLLKHTG